MPSEREELLSADEMVRAALEITQGGGLLAEVAAAAILSPEKELLRAIFGSTIREREQISGSSLQGSFAACLAAALSHGASPVIGGAWPVVGSPIAVLAQNWIKGHLPATEIEEISTLATAVIGDKNKATQWLSEPNIATDNRAPIDLLGEKDGYERVKSLLLRIEYGALA